MRHLRIICVWMQTYACVKQQQRRASPPTFAAKRVLPATLPSRSTNRSRTGYVAGPCSAMPTPAPAPGSMHVQQSTSNTGRGRPSSLASMMLYSSRDQHDVVNGGYSKRTARIVHNHGTGLPAAESRNWPAIARVQQTIPVRQLPSAQRFAVRRCAPWVMHMISRAAAAAAAAAACSSRRLRTSREGQQTHASTHSQPQPFPTSPAPPTPPHRAHRTNVAPLARAMLGFLIPAPCDPVCGRERGRRKRAATPNPPARSRSKEMLSRVARYTYYSK
ncbi:hypothetical protein C8Q80DRAFT_103277 [Daedaleopsis nitida]|nr:hypothetical protein C8Q80DRAFT_103277 [Daedaleopsis nitida]